MSPTVVSSISPEEDAEMERLTAPPTEEETKSEGFEHLDEFVQGLNHEELEYVASACRDALGKEGELEANIEKTPTPEESGATKNAQA